MRLFGKVRALPSRWSSRRGTAMTETALLCFFIYAPVLMMIIIWGDMTLDKERALVAASYMAFSTQPLDDADLVERFFPTATGMSDGTQSIRSVSVEDDTAIDGPVFTLPSSRTGDYSAAGEPPEFDLQYKLYSLAVGRVHITYNLQAMPNGTVGFMATAQRIQNEAGQYLSREGIVQLADIPTNLGTFAAGQMLDLETDADSMAYTYYVATLTDLFNGRWNASGVSAGGVMGNTAPSLESRVGIRTRFTSPFLWDLEREASLGASGEDHYVDLKLARVGGEPGFEMHFGSRDLVSEDDSFRTGYTYLRNPQTQIDASRLRNDFYELSDQIFEYNGQKIHEMDDPLSREKGGDHLLFLSPGDPRPSQEP